MLKSAMVAMKGRVVTLSPAMAGFSTAGFRAVIPAKYRILPDLAAPDP